MKYTGTMSSVIMFEALHGVDNNMKKDSKLQNSRNFQSTKHNKSFRVQSYYLNLFKPTLHQIVVYMFVP